MSMGPIIIFDKSLLQGLNPDEAIWLDQFFISNITPLFYVETLADLAKEMKSGRTPDQIVGELAYKSPNQGMIPNVHHWTLIIQELLGSKITMDTRPILAGGKIKKDPTGKVGFVFDSFPEIEVFDRWQAGDFWQIEREFASKWRCDLANLDFENRIEWVKNIVPQSEKLNSMAEIKSFVDSFVSQSGKELMLFALQFLEIPSEIHGFILARYSKAGTPTIKEFSSYTIYVLRLELFFHLCLFRGFISKERTSNKIDLAYLYYLPFSMAFISGDKLHSRIAPFFMEQGQEYVTAIDFKTALGELNEYYSKYESEIEKEGIMRFAPYPPLELNNAVTKLWDKFCPPWRKHSIDSKENKRTNLPKDKDLLRAIQEQESAPEIKSKIDGDSADFMILKRTSYIRRGKWRILPPEVENKGNK